MSYINTVLGPIAPEQLGITMMHEHLLWNQEVYQNRSKGAFFLFTPVCYHEGRITACLPSSAACDEQETEAMKKLPPDIQAGLQAGKHILVNYHLK